MLLAGTAEAVAYPKPAYERARKESPKAGQRPLSVTFPTLRLGSKQYILLPSSSRQSITHKPWPSFSRFPVTLRLKVPYEWERARWQGFSGIASPPSV